MDSKKKMVVPSWPLLLGLIAALYSGNVWASAAEAKEAAPRLPKFIEGLLGEEELAHHSQRIDELWMHKDTVHIRSGKKFRSMKLGPPLKDRDKESRSVGAGISPSPSASASFYHSPWLWGGVTVIGAGAAGWLWWAGPTTTPSKSYSKSDYPLKTPEFP